MQCIWINLKPTPPCQSLEKLSSMKLVPGAKNVGGHCCKEWNYFRAKFLNTIKIKLLLTGTTLLYIKVLNIIPSATTKKINISTRELKMLQWKTFFNAKDGKIGIEELKSHGIWKRQNGSCKSFTIKWLSQLTPPLDSTCGLHWPHNCWCHGYLNKVAM